MTEFIDSAFGGCLLLRGPRRGKPHSLHVRKCEINNLSLNSRDSKRNARVRSSGVSPFAEALAELVPFFAGHFEVEHHIFNVQTQLREGFLH
jgi:hypothetical protein